MRDTGGYRDFPFAAEFYDHFPTHQSRQDVGFYLSLAVESGGPVLELACGTGRVLLPIAEAGLEVTGLDISEPMLSVCQHKLDALPNGVRSRVTLVCGDMRSFDLDHQFRLVTIPFHAFQHLLTPDEQLSCLASVVRHLGPGGRLALDLFNPDLRRLTDPAWQVEKAVTPPFAIPNGRTLQVKSKNGAPDMDAQRFDAQLIYLVTYPDGREETLVHQYQIRYLYRYEAEHLLARAGLALEAVYSDFDRCPFGAKHPGEIILVAQKAAR